MPPGAEDVSARALSVGPLQEATGPLRLVRRTLDLAQHPLPPRARGPGRRRPARAQMGTTRVRSTVSRPSCPRSRRSRARASRRLSMMDPGRASRGEQASLCVVVVGSRWAGRGLTRTEATARLAGRARRSARPSPSSPRRKFRWTTRLVRAEPLRLVEGFRGLTLPRALVNRATPRPQPQDRRHYQDKEDQEDQEGG